MVGAARVLYDRPRMSDDSPHDRPPAPRSAVAAWARAQGLAREAALTAEQRIVLALTLGRRARALEALAKP